MSSLLAHSCASVGASLAALWPTSSIAKEKLPLCCFYSPSRARAGGAASRERPFAYEPPRG
eukprot:2575824-Pleurochrysis_carterae.AAC.1